MMLINRSGCKENTAFALPPNFILQMISFPDLGSFPFTIPSWTVIRIDFASITIFDT